MPIVRAHSFAHNSLRILTIAGLATIPVIIMTGVHDYFRVIKEVTFRAQAILMLFALVTAVVFGGVARLREMLRERAVVIVVAGGVVWGIITTATSMNRLLSAESLVTAICGAMLFVAIWYVAPSMPLATLLVLAPVVIASVVVAALQAYDIWNPFQFNIVDEFPNMATALIGNANDVGAYFALAAIILMALTLRTRGWQSRAAAVGSGFAVSGILVSQTRTAILALGAGIIVLAAAHSWKRGIAIVALLAAPLVLAIWIPIPGLSRIAQIPRLISQGKIDVMFSYRLSPFLAALEMFRERPLTGRGPGVYAFDEMVYRKRLRNTLMQYGIRTVGLNFSETHNDHLQFLAETGLPGYALFITALVLVARRDKRAEASDDDRAVFAATVGSPLVATLFVLCLASFPVQIAVTRHLILTAAALIIGWKKV